MPTSHFAQSYTEARLKFLSAAASAGLAVRSHMHPLRGRDGEPLAMDVVREGPASAGALLVISSACHGVEGFCGSGLQTALMSSGEWRARVAASGVAVLLIHALNPYGFSWWRRTTHENVDLNRNFPDFTRPLPANAAYAELASALVPDDWPPPPEAVARIAAYAAAHGERGLQTAVTAGQHTHPDGLFYGGREPTWSQHTLRAALREHGTRCERLGWIDVHTGLGPSGHGERIFAGRDDAQALARARAWWGAQVTSIYDGSSSSALLSGLMWLSAYEECAQAEYTGIALEFGTVPTREAIDALRADQWLHNHAQSGAAQREAIKRRVRDAFYTDTPEWKRSIVEQGFDAAIQALRGLAR
jgi:predicted deacylase